jgi:hypothetical protein
VACDDSAVLAGLADRGNYHASARLSLRTRRIPCLKELKSRRKPAIEYGIEPVRACGTARARFGLFLLRLCVLIARWGRGLDATLQSARWRAYLVYASRLGRFPATREPARSWVQIPPTPPVIAVLGNTSGFPLDDNKQNDTSQAHSMPQIELRQSRFLQWSTFPPVAPEPPGLRSNSKEVPLSGKEVPL